MRLSSEVGEEFGRLDFLIHSIAFAPREALEGEYIEGRARSVSDGAGNQRLLAHANGARGRAVDD